MVIAEEIKLDLGCVGIVKRSKTHRFVNLVESRNCNFCVGELFLRFEFGDLRFFSVAGVDFWNSDFGKSKSVLRTNRVSKCHGRHEVYRTRVLEQVLRCGRN